MDTFPEEVNLQKRLQFKRKVKSATSLVATLQLSGRPTGREITTPSSARLSRKRQAAMETNSYGSVISPQLPACATHLMQATPSKEVSTSNQKVQKRQVEERIRQLTSPEHLQDRRIADKEGNIQNGVAAVMRVPRSPLLRWYLKQTKDKQQVTRGPGHPPKDGVQTILFLILCRRDLNLLIHIETMSTL